MSGREMRRRCRSTTSRTSWRRWRRRPRRCRRSSAPSAETSTRPTASSARSPGRCRSPSSSRRRTLRGSSAARPGQLASVRPDVLGKKALNRATLGRQLLLRRSDLSVLQAVEHLVGLQAQVPSNPYIALWSRLAEFRPESLARLLEDRKVVRLPLMRATIHLVSADDCLELRPLMQPVLDAELDRHSEYGPALGELDLEPVLQAARLVLAESPRTGPELRASLADGTPGANPAALAYACRNRLALVQVPPRGVWGRTSQVTTTTAEAWLGRPLETAPSLENAVLRYLA